MNRTMAKTRSSIQAPKETAHVCAERPLQTSLLRYLICYGWFETDGAVALAQLSLTRLRQEDAFFGTRHRPSAAARAQDCRRRDQSASGDGKPGDVEHIHADPARSVRTEVFFHRRERVLPRWRRAVPPEAVRHRIKATIADESQDDALSDDDIVVRPKERAIDLRAAPSQNIAKR